MTNVSYIQINVNRSWSAMDLLKHTMLERDIHVGIISEPPRNLKAGAACSLSRDNGSAVVWRSGSLNRFHCKFVGSGRNFVTVKIGDLYLTSCYISPNVNLCAFEDFLDDLSAHLTVLGGPMLVCGDFNAKSVCWGARMSDRRGMLFECWAASLDLRLVNNTIAQMCVRPQGSSIIDLTLVSPCLAREIVGWSVLDGVETLSDH